MNDNNMEAQDGANLAGTIRINKFLASCGVESRRAADKLIEEGRIEVNGKIIESPGMKVTLEDFVKLDGHRMTPKEEVVVLINKPRGYVCSRDAQGAEGTVFDLLPPKLRHLNYVGRLDADSEGLIIMTNNGALGQKLSHPSCGIEKEYWVTLDQNFENSVLMQLLKGVRIPEGQAKAKYVTRSSARRACVVLEQGLKRQVRQMFQCLGLRARKLVRVRIGSLWGGELEQGSWRMMDESDIELVTRNPKQPKKYLGARELAAYKGTSSNTQAARPVSSSNEDDSYEFNPADFEGLDMDADTFELTPEMKTRFSDAMGPEREEISFERRSEFSSDRSYRERSFGGAPTRAPRREGGFGDRREGGFRREGGSSFGGPRREGGSFGGPRREGGGFGGERREGGGFGGPRREGGSFGGPRREGGSSFGGPRREGGSSFGGPRREGGSSFGGPRREGGSSFGGPRREGGSSFGGPRREGGSSFGGPRREGGSSFGGPRREGGSSFGGPRREGGSSFGGPRREGGSSFGGPRREGGSSFGGPRREGGSSFGGPRREGGGFGGGPRREGGGSFGGPRREGGSSFGGPRREGGSSFGGPRREGGGFGGGPRREGGGSFGGPRREGGSSFGGPRREGGSSFGGPRREGGSSFGGPRREGGGFGGGPRREGGGFRKDRGSN